ncbi:hypothetical protein EEB18_011620 [Sphingopyxis sp. OPL5]|uniref:hypothetical protein n=1 Tax=Sphingopyxis sp. OPL5 TaxID=2486273 RepID=UPI00164DE1C6|nr:hypothetical protein [Sphingopyxis sp. OPL5]QNO25457.1 hypothetical protein EEB18_011620 [Sphingopyxis sp. OPL5]
MQMTKLAAIGAAALLALSGTAATAQNATPFCSKSVTDNCMQREGHAVAAHRAPARHHAAAKHRVAAKHHAVKHHVAKHRVAAKHSAAPHRAVAAKAVPAPAHKM